MTARDLRAPLEFFDAGRRDGGSFDAGIQFALERILVDPDFSEATAGSLIEIVTITGLADGSTIDDAFDNPDLVVVP